MHANELTCLLLDGELSLLSLVAALCAGGSLPVRWRGFSTFDEMCITVLYSEDICTIRAKLKIAAFYSH